MLAISEKLIKLNYHHKKQLVKKLGTDVTFIKLTEDKISKFEEIITQHNECTDERIKSSIRSYLFTDLFGLENNFCLLDSGRLNYKQVKIGLDFRFENLED